MNKYNIIYATREARKSETIKLYHTPSVAKNVGKIHRQGNRNINCLESDRNIERLGLPILWKKFPITIEDATNGNIMTIRRKPSADF